MRGKSNEKGRSTAKTMGVMLMLLCLMFSLSACRAVEDTESAVERGWDDLTGETGTMHDGVYEEDRNHNGTLDNNETLNHKTNGTETEKNGTLNHGTENQTVYDGVENGTENGTVHEGTNSGTNGTERNRTTATTEDNAANDSNVRNGNGVNGSGVNGNGASGNGAVR